MNEKNEARTLPTGETKAEGLLALHQRNLDALHRSMTTALDGVHALASRSCDLTSDAQHRLALLKWPQSVPAPLNDGVSSVIDVAKRSIEESFAQAVSLAEIATKAQLDALTIFGRIICDGLDASKPNGGAALLKK